MYKHVNMNKCVYILHDERKIYVINVFLLHKEPKKEKEKKKRMQ